MEKSEPANPAALIKEKLRQMFAIRQRMRALISAAGEKKPTLTNTEKKFKVNTWI